MALFWIKQKNRHLGNIRPVEVLSRGGRNDLISVLSLLDCTVHWDVKQRGEIKAFSIKLLISRLIDLYL